MDAGDSLLNFGRFTFDPASGDLRSGGRIVRLQPQPARVLHLLLERAGQLVTREEIRAVVWPDTKVEFDQGLNYCVRQIRAALGERAGSPVYVETLPRRGYRFIAPVERVGGRVGGGDTLGGGAAVRSSVGGGIGLGAPAAPQSGGGAFREPGETPPRAAGEPGGPRTGSEARSFASSPPPTPRPAGPVAVPAATDGRRLARALALATTALALMFVVTVLTLEPTTDATAERALVAVLPLTVIDPADTAALTPVGRGFSEVVITELVQLDPDRLGVIARPSALRVHGTDVDPVRVADELDADFVVTGSVRTDGARAHVTARMTRADDGVAIWAIDRELEVEELLSVPSDVGREVVSEVASSLAPGAPVRQIPVSKLARADRDRYLRARYLMTIFRRSTMERAAELLDSVLVNAPDFVPALSGRAYVAGLFSDNHLTLSAATRALELEPDAHEAHWVLANLHMDELRWREARASFDEALRLAPGVAEYHRSMAFYHSYSGDHDNALRHLERALELDPVSPVVRGDLGLIHLAAGRPGEAIEACRLMEQLSTEPSMPAHLCQLRAHLALADSVGAVKQAHLLVRLGGESTLTGATPTQLLVEFWNRRLDEARVMAPSPYRSIQEAEAWTALGRPEQALDALEEAAAIDPRPLLDAAGNPVFGAVSDEPRWRALLESARPERGQAVETPTS